MVVSWSVGRHHLYMYSSRSSRRSSSSRRGEGVEYSNSKEGEIIIFASCNLQDRAGSSFLVLARFRGRANLVNLANQIVEDLVYVDSLLSRGL